MNINKLYEKIQEDNPMKQIMEQLPGEEVPADEPLPGPPKNAEEPITNEEPTNKVNAEEGEAPEVEKPDKEFFGSKGQDVHYYMLRVKGEGENTNIVDLQITDANGVLKYSAKENNLSVEDELDFVKHAIETLAKDMDMISIDLVNEFDLLNVKKEENEEELKRKKAAGLHAEETPEGEEKPQMEQPAEQPAKPTEEVI